MGTGATCAINAGAVVDVVKASEKNRTPAYCPVALQGVAGGHMAAETLPLSGVDTPVI